MRNKLINFYQSGEISHLVTLIDSQYYRNQFERLSVAYRVAPEYEAVRFDGAVDKVSLETLVATVNNFQLSVVLQFQRHLTSGEKMLQWQIYAKIFCSKSCWCFNWMSTAKATKLYKKTFFNSPSLDALVFAILFIFYIKILYLPLRSSLLFNQLTFTRKGFVTT